MRPRSLSFIRGPAYSPVGTGTITLKGGRGVIAPSTVLERPA